MMYYQMVILENLDHVSLVFFFEIFQKLVMVVDYVVYQRRMKI